MDGFPEDLAARFEPTRLLGAGAFGSVYAARDREGGREVAVKVLHPWADENLQERFRREAHLLAGLRHPNILHLLDYGVREDGEPYLVTELLEGASLAERPDHGDLAGVVRQVIAAFEELHSAGLVHRDVKPANIVVTPEGRAVLVDFGLAKPRTSDTLTATGTVPGTIAFLPPEALRGEAATAQWDWFGLGVTLFSLLEGRLPYAAEDLMQIQVGKPAPALRFRDVAEADPLAQLALACLAVDPALRPRGRAEAEALLRGDGVRRVAVPAPDPGPFAGGPAPQGRRLALLEAAAGVLALGLVVGGLSSGSPEPVPDPPPSRADELPRGGGEETSSVFASERVEELERATRAVLRRHGRLEDRVLVVDPHRSLEDPALREHLADVGWGSRAPRLDRLEGLAVTVALWLQDLRAHAGGDSEVAVLADREAREVFRRVVQDPLRHLLEDLRSASNRGDPASRVFGVLGESDAPGAMAELAIPLLDALAWGDVPVPSQVLALRGSLLALYSPEATAAREVLEELVARLPGEEDPEVVRDLARALLPMVAATDAAAIVPPDLRVRALGAVVDALGAGEAPGDGALLARVVVEWVRAARLGTPDLGEPARVLKRPLARLCEIPDGPALLPDLVARCERVATAASGTPYGAGSAARARPFLAAVEAWRCAREGSSALLVAPRRAP